MRTNSGLRGVRVPPTLIAAALCAAAIAGCGGGGSDAPQGIAATPAASSNVGWAPSRLTSETPIEIFKKSAAALAKAKTFRMQGTLHPYAAPDKWMKVSVYMYSPQPVLVSAVLPRGGFSMILDGGSAYFRADEKFMSVETHHAAIAPLFANRWFTYPQSEARKLTSDMGRMQPTTLSKCMLSDPGKLSLAGYKMVGNQRAIVIRSAADEPGQQRSLIAVALYGPPYPLQIRGYGKPLPGHARGNAACGGNSSGPNYVGSLTLSAFNSLPRLDVPTHAPSLQQYAEALRAHEPAV